MALVLNDRVKETSTTTGTGTLTLDGAVQGFETFSSAIGNSNTTFYAIELPGTTEFEVGRGTISAGQLARTEIISSSNSDSAVDFSAGTKIVFCTLPASKFVPGKFQGSNFGNSILVGHSTTGSLNNATGNVGVGVTALDALVSGDNNVAMGFGAGSAISTGTQNVAIGQDALTVNNNGNENTAVGGRASRLLTNGTGNTTLGYNAGTAMNNADADYNILIGHSAGDNITEGAGNVIIGSVDAAAADGDRTLKIAGYDGSTTTTWISGDNSGNLTFPADLTVDTNTLHVDSSNNRVGIGTASPSSALDVSGGITADGNNNSIIHDITRQTGATNASRPVINLTAKNTAADVSDGFGPALEFKLQDNTADTQLGAIGFIRDGADGSGAFVVGQDSQFLHSLPQFLIDSSGNVGIGTSSPSAQLHITGSDTTDQVIFENTDTGSGSAPDLVFYRNSSSPAVNDLLGRIDFRGKNDGGTSIDYGFIYGVIEDETAGTEDGALWFNLEKNGSVIQPLKLKSNENVFNDNGEDINFRIEGNNDANIFFVDAGNDRIGIGTATPARDLQIAKSTSGGTVRLEVNNESNTGSSHGVISIYSGGTSGGDPYLHFKVDNGEQYSIGIDNDQSDALVFSNGFGVGSNNLLSIATDGSTTFTGTITADSGKDVILGKNQGTNFTNSLLVGHNTTGTLSSAENNTGVGIGALDAITSGNANVAVGQSAGTNLTTGSLNIFIGKDAGSGATDPLGNIGIGATALGSADPGNNNIAIGESAGKLITGVRNLVIGENAGDNITSGSGNVIIGSAVDPSSATDNRQLIIAGNDGSTTTTWISGDNTGALTFADKVVLAANKTIEFGDSGETISGDGTDMTVASSGVLNLNSAASTGPAIKLASSAGGVLVDSASLIVLDADNADNGIQYKDGATEMLRIHNSSSDVILHTKVQDKDLKFKGNDGGSDITALTLDMSEAGMAKFNSSIAMGSSAISNHGAGDLTGVGKLVFGSNDANTNARIFKASNVLKIQEGTSGFAIIDAGSNDTFVIDSNQNISIPNGNLTLGANLDVSSGTIKLDGDYPTGSNNVALGDTALDSVTSGGQNTAIGSIALTALTTASFNTAIGYKALEDNISGTKNTAIGSNAASNTTGANNVAIGVRTLFFNTSGGKNTAVGEEALLNGTSASQNTALGYQAGTTVSGGSNLTILGYQAEPSSGTATNEITLGNASVTSLRIPGLASGASSGDVLTYDGTDITLSAPTGVSAGFAVAMAIAL